MAKVLGIYIAPSAGTAVAAVPQARAIRSAGLEGDRYGEGVGAFSNAKRVTIRQLSFIAIEDFRAANALAETPFTIEETRRNVLTEGVDLQSLIGKEFSVGGVRMRGIEDCTPCARPSNLSGKPGFAEAFAGRGGLRAEVLETGLIKVGDPIVAPE